MMKKQQLQGGPIVRELADKSKFIQGFMGAPGQVPGNPMNAAKAVPSWFAAPGDHIAYGYRKNPIPYGDREYEEDTQADLQYVQPISPSQRIMAPLVAGSKTPGMTPNAGVQMGLQFPASNFEQQVTAAAMRNEPPPENIRPVPISQEARGMSTSVAGPGAGPQRNVPAPQGQLSA